jgi:hypothetical protein
MWSMRNTNCRTRTLVAKLKKVENETQTLYILEYCEKHWKTRKMRYTHCRTWNMAWKSVIREIFRNTEYITWILARKMKNVENKTQTKYDLEYGNKHWKPWKMKIAHCRIWNMARQLTNEEKRNSHNTTWNMARNTEKRVKWETYCRTWNMVRKCEKL